MKIALLNVKYSPNLGDGLLSECLERELGHALPGAQVFSIDLAGRTAYPGLGPSRRGQAIAVLEAMPLWLRQRLARLVLTALVRLRLRRHARAALEGCSAAVLGGGNLLTDADLNFPMKIAGALAEVRAKRIPLAVHAVGASRNWSAAGRKLFADALKSVRLTTAAVRDERSRLAWDSQLEPAGLPPAGLVGDPGLLASLHFARGPAPDDAPRAGLCITAPMALRYHSDDAHGDDDLDEWYAMAARSLVEEGYAVALFTNGSPEDRAYLARLGPQWIRAAKGPVTITNPFANPAELTAFISGCAMIVAHRMHACIAAHSFGIPTIGLAWDIKLDSFFELAGRPDFIAATADLTEARLRALIRRAGEEGVDRVALNSLIASTRADVGAMGQRLIAAAAAANPLHPSMSEPLPG